MPAMAHNHEVDAQPMALLRRWIESLPGPPVLPPPVISPPGGNYKQPLTVTLETQPGATIRYTLDGTVPTTSDLLYEKPIQLTGPTIVRARAFKPGFTRSITSQDILIIGAVIMRGELRRHANAYFPTGTTTTPQGTAGRFNARDFLFGCQIHHRHVIRRAVGGEEIFSVRRNGNAPGAGANLDRVQHLKSIRVHHANGSRATGAGVNLLSVGRDLYRHRAGAFWQGNGLEQFLAGGIDYI